MAELVPSRSAHQHLNHVEVFYLCYGQTLAAWAELEQNLARVFCILCNMNSACGLGPALFFSGRSFATRADLLTAAVDAADKDLETALVIRAIIKKARQFSSARNAIAHGVPASFWENGHTEGIRIKEGKRAYEHGGIGLPELHEAHANFSTLSMLARKVYVAADEGRLQEHLERVQALPKDAYKQPN
jgi:hypothetical protein